MNLTLSQRLSVAFSILLLACCGASAWLQIRANDLHEEEVVQGLSRGLAEHIALNTELTDANGLNPAAVRALFGQLMVVNPSVEVYLLDRDGHITGHAAPAGHLKREQVDLEPVRRLLAGQPLPIRGDDPRSLDGRQVFSAAPLHAQGRDAGYIYVVLLGEARTRLDARVAASAVLRTTLWSMALVALLGLAAGLLAFGWITRPLRRLSAAMRHFDADAPLPALPELAPVPARPGTRDEIVVLEHAFAQMAARIGAQWRTLTQQDRERRELVANISHDLRTPLASLHGYLETLSLKADTLSETEQRRYLATALSQSRKVGQLAQALFELARLEHGFVQPVLENFSLADLLQDVFQKFELSAEAKQVRLSAQLPHQAPLVCADLGMMERVLTNLLDNAIRHTPPGGDIEVSVGHRDGRVTVTISDSGPGIPQALRDTLFRRPLAFGGTRNSGGLGLLIVQRMLQLHHAQIALVERAQRGATFYFELPGAAP
jgi:signal transduction histidine kinase